MRIGNKFLVLTIIFMFGVFLTTGELKSIFILLQLITAILSISFNLKEILAINKKAKLLEQEYRKMREERKEQEINHG